MEYSQIVLSYMKERSVSAYKLSKATGISESTFSKWRSNPTSDIAMSTLFKIADFFGISIDELLGKADIKKAPPSEDESANERINRLMDRAKLLDDDSLDAVLKIAEGLAAAKKQKTVSPSKEQE